MNLFEKWQNSEAQRIPLVFNLKENNTGKKVLKDFPIHIPTQLLNFGPNDIIHFSLDEEGKKIIKNKRIFSSEIQLKTKFRGWEIKIPCLKKETIVFAWVIDKNSIKINNADVQIEIEEILGNLCLTTTE